MCSVLHCMLTSSVLCVFNTTCPRQPHHAHKGTLQLGPQAALSANPCCCVGVCLAGLTSRVPTAHSVLLSSVVGPLGLLSHQLTKVSRLVLGCSCQTLSCCDKQRTRAISTGRAQSNTSAVVSLVRGRLSSCTSRLDRVARAPAGCAAPAVRSAFIFVTTDDMVARRRCLLLQWAYALVAAATGRDLRPAAKPKLEKSGQGTITIMPYDK